jgi:hypothetical protein
MKSLVVLVFALCLLVLVGCGPGAPSEAAAVGTWTGTFKGEGVEPFDYTLEVREDKSFTMSNTLGVEESGTWRYEEGGKLHLDYGMGEAEGLSPARPRQSTLLMRNDREMDHKTSTGKGTPDFAKKL